MKQVEGGQKTKHIVCWVDTPEPIQQGYSITLKSAEGYWLLDKINEITLERTDNKKTWVMGGV